MKTVAPSEAIALVCGNRPELVNREACDFAVFFPQEGSFHASMPLQLRNTRL
jgi:hypothetical protein